MRIILQLIVATFALCLTIGATLASIVGCFLAEGGGKWLCAGGLSVAAVTTYLAVRWIVALNNQWKREFQEKFDDNDQLLARWTVQPAQWASLAEFERAESQRDAPMVALWSGLIFGGVVTFGCWSTFGSTTACMAGGVTALIFGTLGWWLEKRAGHRPYFRKFADTETTIAIREDGMVVGTLPVAWSGMYGKLTSFTCSTPDELSFSILTVEVRRRTGEGSVYHTYRVPLPVGHTELPPCPANRQDAPMVTVA